MYKNIRSMASTVLLVNDQKTQISSTLREIISMKKILFSCIVVSFVTACNNDKATNAENSGAKSGNVTSKGQNAISFKVNGDEVITSGWNIGRFRWNNESAVWMNITSDMHKEKRTINVNLNGGQPGTYKFDETGVIMQKSHGSYHPDFGNPSESYSFVSGSFVITEVDTVRNIVNGTFSGTAKNSKGESVNITDGKIVDGALKPGIINL